jgi:hypothetical protein
LDEVERHIAAYRAASLDANGEAWGRTDALEALEQFLPDRRVLDFFLGVIADPAEYDMARVQLLKLFEVNPVPAARRRVGECVAAAMLGEQDWMVRFWLGRAISRYNDIPAARAAAVACVLDPAEDRDVRHNCLFLPRRQRDDPAVGRALAQLAAGDGLLARAARRELEIGPDAEPSAAADPARKAGPGS